jgi:hypothetical protein
MWKLDFQISGLPADDGERRQKRDDNAPRNRKAIWLIAGLVLAYIFGAGAQPGDRVAIISPANGSSTLEAQVVVVGTSTGAQDSLVTLRVNNTTQTAPVSNGVFQSQVVLAEGRNEISAYSGDLKSQAITVIRKPRPILRIDSPPPVFQTQDPVIRVLGIAQHLDGDSITLEVNGAGQSLQASGGRFSTDVPLAVGANGIRALAPGGDPASIVVFRTEPGKPAIAITTPTSGFSTESESVKIVGTVVNSNAPEITLKRNSISTRVRVASGQFEDTINLDVGRNEIQAFVADVSSDAVIVNRKLHPRIVIATETPVSTRFLVRSAVANVRIIGTVENLETDSVWMSLNNATRGRVAVRNGKFGDNLELKAGGVYRIQASIGEVFSNELVINIPAQPPEQTGPAPPGMPEDCARIQCDCEHLGSPVFDAQPRTFSRVQPNLALRKRCLAIQQTLRAQCEKTLQWPSPCPAQASGPNAWAGPQQKK